MDFGLVGATSTADGNPLSTPGTKEPSALNTSLTVLSAVENGRDQSPKERVAALDTTGIIWNRIEKCSTGRVAKLTFGEEALGHLESHATSIKSMLIRDGFRLGSRLASPSSFAFSLRTRLRISLFTMGAIGTQTVNTSKRLAALRELMSQPNYNVNAMVVPSEDQRSCSNHGPHPHVLTSEQTPANISLIAMNGGRSSPDSLDQQVRHTSIRSKGHPDESMHTRLCSNHVKGRVFVHRWSLLPPS